MLIEFIYTSYASEPFLSEQLTALQKQCQDHNNPNQITGMLLYDNQQFMQVLEGEQAVIEALFKKIKSDPRHQQVKALIHTPKPHLKKKSPNKQLILRLPLLSVLPSHL